MSSDHKSSGRRTVNGVFVVLGLLPFIVAVSIVTRGQLREQVISVALWVSAGTVCWAAVLLPYNWRCRFATLLVSTLVALFALEIGLYIVDPPLNLQMLRDRKMAERAVRAEAMGIPYDTRSLIEVILDLRTDGTPAYPSGNFETYLREHTFMSELHAFSANSTSEGSSVIQIDGADVLPLSHLGEATVVGVENENGYYPTFRTDKHGFRNPSGLWSSMPADIVGLGDSFTEGCEVRDQESFMSRIRERYPRTFNLGLGGGGPFTMLAALREYGQALKPKVVLWCYFEGNDLDDFQGRFDHPILRRYVDDASFRQELLGRQDKLQVALQSYFDKVLDLAEKMHPRRQRASRPPLSSVLSLQNTRVKFQRSLEVARSKMQIRLRSTVGRSPQNQARSKSGQDQADDRLLSELKTVLAMAQREARSWGGTVCFVYLPTWNRAVDPHYAAFTLPHQAVEELDDRAQVLRLVKSLEMPVIDICEPFATHPDPTSLFPFRLFGHYNAEGHRVVSDAILAQLAEETWLRPEQTP